MSDEKAAPAGFDEEGPKTVWDQFDTDPTLERGGVEVQFDGFSITVRRAGGANKRYDKMLEARTKPYRYALQNDAVSNVLADKIMRDVYAETIVVTWSGVTDKQGATLECTRENIVMLFEQLPALFEMVKKAASQYSIFRKAELEDSAGN